MTYLEGFTYSEEADGNQLVTMEVPESGVPVGLAASAKRTSVIRLQMITGQQWASSRVVPWEQRKRASTHSRAPRWTVRREAAQSRKRSA